MPSRLHENVTPIWKREGRLGYGRGSTGDATPTAGAVRRVSQLAPLLRRLVEAPPIAGGQFTA